MAEAARKYLKKARRFETIDREFCAKNGLTVQKIIQMNNFLHAKEQFSTAPDNIIVFVDRGLYLFTKSQFDFELKEVSTAEFMAKFEENEKRVRFLEDYPPVTIPVLFNMSKTELATENFKYRYNFKSEVYSKLRILAPPKEPSSLKPGDFFIAKAVLFKFNSANIDPTPIGRTEALEEILKNNPDAPGPPVTLASSETKPTIVAAPLAPIIEKVAIEKIAQEAIKPLIVEPPVTPSIKPVVNLEADRLWKENSELRLEKVNLVGKIDDLKSKFKIQENEFSRKEGFLNFKLKELDTQLANSKKAFETENELRKKAVLHAKSLEDEQYKGISYNIDDIKSIKMNFVYDTKEFFFNLSFEDAPLAKRNKYLEVALEQWMSNAISVMNSHSSDIVTQRESLFQFKQTVLNDFHEAKVAYSEKNKELKKKNKALKKDIKYLESQIDEMRIRHVEEKSALKLKIFNSDVILLHEKEYHNNLLKALTTFELLVDEKNKLLPDTDYQRWLCFSKPQLRKHFEKKYKMAGFLSFDPKELNKELSTQMFLILEYICNKTGSKSVLWYGHYLNKIFNNRVANKYPKTEDQHVQRFFDTWGQWAGFTLNLGLQKDFETNKDTLECLHYAHMLVKINCQRFAFKVLDFID
jgi:cell division protein FtsB